MCKDRSAKVEIQPPVARTLLSYDDDGVNCANCGWVSINHTATNSLLKQHESLGQWFFNCLKNCMI